MQLRLVVNKVLLESIGSVRLSLVLRAVWARKHPDAQDGKVALLLRLEDKVELDGAELELKLVLAVIDHADCERTLVSLLVERVRRAAEPRRLGTHLDVLPRHEKRS